ncbi:nitroreductase [Rhodovulum sp. DZ06]|uniref:nitroreductase n=1 Tax=Rhodovulum sp. DZ06 TaxID=3425126 RepID=UPI003D34BCDA
MQVREAMEKRISVRAFRPDPVPREVLADCLRRAARAPSGGNLQPWIATVVDGEKWEALKEKVAAKIAAQQDQGPEYEIYPPNLHDPYRSRRFAVGEAMYARLGIPREDKPARLRWFANNFRAFGAPAMVFVHLDRRMGPPQWADAGMFLQSFMLLLQEAGYDSCAQEAWAVQHATVDPFVGADPETLLFCGVAVGKADPEHPVNGLRTDRAPEEEWLRFL